MENTLRSFAASMGISIAAAFCCAAPVHAQRHVTFMIGPDAGYNFVMYRSDAFPTLHSEPTAFIVQSGTGRGYFAGLSAEDPLSANMHHFLIFEVGYDTKPATFTSISGGPPDTMLAISSTTLSTELSYIEVNVGYKYNLRADSIPNGLGIQLCLSIGIKYEANFVWDYSPRPPNYPVGDAATIATADALRLALRPELTYDLPLTETWILTPFAGYEFPLTKVDPTENWWASALYGGLALRYAIW